MYQIIYFSSLSGNTHKFVSSLNLPAKRIPLSPKSPAIDADKPYILFTPTYADAEGRGAVPKPVIRFLNSKANRDLMAGVIAGGNTNFGKFYGYAGNVIAKKCKVPLLYKFELTGTNRDIINIREGITKLWHQQQKQLIKL